MSLFNQQEAAAYQRMLYGDKAFQIPFNCIVQPMGGDAILAAVLIRGPEAVRLALGSKTTHQLILGDAVIRPRLAFESDHLRGSGFASIASHGFTPDDWVANGKVIMGSIEELMEVGRR